MDTSPKDQAALLPGYRVPAPAPPKPGEPLFAFLRGHVRFACELRTHGTYGVEAQFFRNEELWTARTFPTRELAIHWAELERVAIEHGEDEVEGV